MSGILKPHDVPFSLLSQGTAIVGITSQENTTASNTPISASMAICLCDGTWEKSKTTKTEAVVRVAKIIGLLILRKISPLLSPSRVRAR